MWNVCIEKRIMRKPFLRLYHMKPLFWVKNSQVLAIIYGPTKY